jgi:ATP synthase I chain
VSPAANPDIRFAYWLTLAIGVAGCALYLTLADWRPALAFLLGSFGSLGNLWLFEWLARAISPDGASRKPWQASAFIGRYIILIGFGYVIVKALSINALALILGLFSSTAAMLFSSLAELLGSFRGSRRAN